MPAYPFPTIIADLLLAQSEAYMTGQRIGMVIGVLSGIAILLGVWGFCGFAIYKACARRTAGWIVVACLGGLLLIVMTVMVGAAFVTGFNKGRQKAASGDGIVSTTRPSTLQGKRLPYTVTVPAGWTVKRGVRDFDAVMMSRTLGVGVIAEEGEYGNTESLVGAAQDNLRQASTNATFGEAAPARIDGHDWLRFTAKCEVDHVPFGYQCYVYAGPEGTYQLNCWTMQNLYEQKAEELSKVAATFRFPTATSLATSEGTPPPLKQVSGTKLAYQLSVPSDWVVKPGNDRFDLRLVHGSIYLGVDAFEGSLGKPETVVAGARKQLEKSTTNLQMTAPVPVKIDGRDWLEFSAKCDIQKIPFAYQFHVYAGPEGTYSIVGWIVQNLYERDADKMRAAALTFRFPPHAAAASPAPEATSATSPAPATSATPTPPPKRKRK